MVHLETCFAVAPHLGFGGGGSDVDTSWVVQSCDCWDRNPMAGLSEDFISTYKNWMQTKTRSLHQAEQQPVACDATPQASERRCACSGLRARAACIRGGRLASTAGPLRTGPHRGIYSGSFPYPFSSIGGARADSTATLHRYRHHAWWHQRRAMADRAAGGAGDTGGPRRGVARLLLFLSRSAARCRDLCLNPT
ncbi:hypothetical protein GW17_00060559 [Ensete ventricosum]|nr:hypothetical protein GW17_00060559 [Ensete ventricosum]